MGDRLEPSWSRQCVNNSRGSPSPFRGDMASGGTQGSNDAASSIPTTIAILPLSLTATEPTASKMLEEGIGGGWKDCLSLMPTRSSSSYRLRILRYLAHIDHLSRLHLHAVQLNSFRCPYFTDELESDIFDSRTRLAYKFPKRD
jgi:hypothetical protein